MVFTYVVTGANRGIGLGIVQQLVKKDDVKVIATARNPAAATELKKLADETKKIEIAELDAESKDSIEKFGSILESVAPEGVDFLIGNAGANSFPVKSIDLDYEDYIRLFKINSIGNVFVFKAAYPSMLKKQTRKVVFISSALGSITNFYPFPGAAYGVSKVAINYLAKSLNLDHGASEGFTFVPLHPGMVVTDMAKTIMDFLKIDGIPDVDNLTPEQSAIKIVEQLDKLERSDDVKFLSYEGTELPF